MVQHQGNGIGGSGGRIIGRQGQVDETGPQAGEMARGVVERDVENLVAEVAAGIVRKRGRMSFC